MIVSPPSARRATMCDVRATHRAVEANCSSSWRRSRCFFCWAAPKASATRSLVPSVGLLRNCVNAAACPGFTNGSGASVLLGGVAARWSTGRAVIHGNFAWQFWCSCHAIICYKKMFFFLPKNQKNVFLSSILFYLVDIPLKGRWRRPAWRRRFSSFSSGGSSLGAAPRKSSSQISLKTSIATLFLRHFSIFF